MTSVADLDRAVSASGRSRMYSLLATALAYPTQAGMDGIAGALAEGAPGFPSDLAGPLDALASSIPAGLATLQRCHQRLFPQIESMETPGYETAYRGDEIFNHAAIMADIAGFYRAFGLEVGGATRERPDHITVELEFLAFLAFKEALRCEQADDEQADVCAAAERSFLTDHLGDWGPELGRRLEQHADHEFYRLIGRILDLWIVDRLDDLGVEPDGNAGAVSTSPIPEPSSWEPVVLGDKP